MTDSVPPVLPIEGVIRRYEWGSRTAIPRLLGLEPDGRPVAELWFGAHHGDPSPALGTTLDELVAADPEGLLGAAAVGQFGPRLPFLLKVLAAERALSIQVHPTLAQARAGFAAEEAAGVARDAPERNYADDNHKPELLCALTPFEALCGFRPVAETLALLDETAIPELVPLVDLLRGPDPLRSAFTALLTLDDRAPLVAAVSAAASLDGPLRASHLAAEHFPGDIGVVLALLLNHVRLEPGEAIYLGAGNVHAYLRGTGVEIMASSDNVLRCGLTPKRVDVAELLKITDFSELIEPRWPAVAGGVASEDFEVPVPDFRLADIDVDGFGDGDGRGGSLAVGLPGPHIVLCAAGQVEVTVDETVVALSPGQAAFVGARPRAFGIRGAGRVFTATTA